MTAIKNIKRVDNKITCGIDEVGRGPLAGPVMAACVFIPQEHRHHDFWQTVTDSKKLSFKKREILFTEIKAHSFYGFGQASPEEIDTLNIHHATLLAMKRAYHTMQTQFDVIPEYALIDGKFTPDLDCPAEAIKGGDGIVTSISAASILAKVTRDKMMAALANDNPGYGWERNAGYGTKEHLRALKTIGITEHHRRSFAPVRKTLESR